MKRLFSLLLLCISFSINTQAQFHASLTGLLTIPAKNYSEIDYGAGLQLSTGYLIKQRLDFEIGFGNIWCSSIITLDRIKYIQPNVRFYFLTKRIKPFMSFGFGYYQKRLTYPDGTYFKENKTGISPSIGVLTKISEHFSINTSISYSKVFFNSEMNIINLNVGLFYYF